jgi:hypothetical protein
VKIVQECIKQKREYSLVKEARAGGHEEFSVNDFVSIAVIRKRFEIGDGQKDRKSWIHDSQPDQ